MSGRASAVAAMTAVHEQVDDGAEQKQRIRHCSQDVGSVLLPEEKRSDCQEKAHAKPHRESKRFASRVLFSCGLHDDLLVELYVNGIRQD